MLSLALAEEEPLFRRPLRMALGKVVDMTVGDVGRWDTTVVEVEQSGESDACSGGEGRFRLRRGRGPTSLPSLPKESRSRSRSERSVVSSAAVVTEDPTRTAGPSPPPPWTSILWRLWMYSTACLRVSTLDIFLCLAADGMWLRSCSKPQLTCFTRFRSLAFLRATLAGCGGGMAYPRVGWWKVAAACVAPG